jgi:hypothetical protein
MLPFSNIPKQIKIKFIYFIVLWLNTFPVKAEILATYSPRELLVCWRLDYKKHFLVLPGLYGEVHDKPVPTNTKVWQTHEGIALSPTGNLQGSVILYCINTGRVLKSCSFTQMPMPDQVIKCVNAIGAQKGQGRAFQFLNQTQDPYKWTARCPRTIQTSKDSLTTRRRRQSTQTSVLSFQEWNLKRMNKVINPLPMNQKTNFGTWQLLHWTVRELIQMPNYTRLVALPKLQENMTAQEVQPLLKLMTT